MNESRILIGRKGKIIAGDQAGWFVLVQDDQANTGGFLILTSPDVSFKAAQGFDNWVEKIEDLRGYFENEKWEIEWLEPDDASAHSETPGATR
jgi:hypothetical protein